MAYTTIGTTTSLNRQSAPSAQSVPSGRAQFVGVTEKGPMRYQETVTNINEYERLFGGRTPYSSTYDYVRAFFNDGGAEAFITRVVGAAASNGSVTLTDGSEEAPVEVLTIQVIDPGAHSADYRAVVTQRPDAGFDLTITDTVSGRTITSFQAAESPADLANMAWGNRYVQIKDLGAGVNPAPGVFSFAAGSDDRANVSVTDYVAAADAHKVPSGVAVLTPGLTAQAAAELMGRHAEEKGKLYLADLDPELTIDEAVAIGDQLMGKAHSTPVLVFYPAVRIPDTNRRTRTVGASAYAAAARSVTHRLYSPAQPPAGQERKASVGTVPVVALDQDDINELNQHGINGIQTTGGVAFLNNWSSLSTDPSLREAAHTDALNQIRISLEAATAPLVWRPNEGLDRIRGEAAAAVETVMQPYYAAGYLFPTLDAEGNMVDSGWTVTVENIRESGQNSPYGKLGVTVGVKLSPIIRNIVVGIRAADLNTAL